MFGDQVTSAFYRGLVDPSRSETQGVELCAEHSAHGADAGEVVGAAVDVDQALKECDRGRGALVDGAGDAALGVGERWRGGWALRRERGWGGGEGGREGGLEAEERAARQGAE